MDGAVREAVGWVAGNLPVYAVNIVMSTATDLWALRYPDSHELYVLDRREPRAARTSGLDLRSARIHARSAQLAEFGSVVVASEPMDDDPAWRLLDPGELVHVDADLHITRRLEFPDAPVHLLRREDLSAQAQAAQHPQESSAARHLPGPHGEQ